MTAFIIISLASVVLYGSGLMRWWLNKCRLYEPQPAQPEPLTASEDPEVIQEEPQEQTLETLDRLQLENDALQILSNKGVANAHIYIKMYSINDLLDIIKNN